LSHLLETLGLVQDRHRSYLALPESGAFKPEKFEEHCQTALRQLVQEKMKGKKIISEPETSIPANDRGRRGRR
jgi:hypothetical protein